MIDVRLLTECKLGHHIGGGGGGSSSRRIASGVGGDAVDRRSRASRRDVAAGAGYVLVRSEALRISGIVMMIECQNAARFFKSTRKLIICFKLQMAVNRSTIVTWVCDWLTTLNLREFAGELHPAVSSDAAAAVFLLHLDARFYSF